MQLQNWRNDGLMMTAAINVSAQDLSHSEFLSFLLNQLDQFDVNPDQITLELTERDIMTNEDLVIERLTQLKKIGITISVDDYGIGQSSLGKLKQLPVDELKIDKSFILKLSESDKDQKIVSSTRFTLLVHAFSPPMLVIVMTEAAVVFGTNSSIGILVSKVKIK